MSKPGRDFEEAVYAFANTLDPKAEVLFDHQIPDRDTGELRQCDVWINAKFGEHWPLSILVSCKDHRRKLHVGDIGTFCDEVRSTCADMGVIYSRTGFTAPAIAKAKANKISCCKLYQNEPADIPLAVYFNQFVCHPTIQLSLQTDLKESGYKTWDDLFALSDCNETQTMLDGLAEAFRKGEECSLAEGRRLLEQKEAFFPPNWQQNLSTEGEEDKRIFFTLMGRWRRYRSSIEATLLNGSYCFSNGAFKGEVIGPSIDTKGPHPGEAWTEIMDEVEAYPQSASILITLSGGDVKSTLKEKLGPTSLFEES